LKFAGNAESMTAGPREGFQFDGIERTDAIAFDGRPALIAALGETA
jgi:hypothetical protein